MRTLIVAASMLAIAACGTMNQDSKSNKPAVSEDTAKSVGATLPSVTLIRVPVGADGKEINEKAEMRLTSATEISKDNVEASFASAQAPSIVVDELDKSSSTESFHGYRRCCYYSYGYYGYNYNWSFYRPVYYNYGYYYNWNYANTYYWGGYNYYRYNSAFAYGYSGYGYAY